MEGYQRSADVGKLTVDGSHTTKISEGRTSTNAWCNGPCYRNATAQAVIHRLSDLTGVPEENSEYLQMLRYEPGQYYHVSLSLNEQNDKAYSPSTTWMTQRSLSLLPIPLESS